MLHTFCNGKLESVTSDAVYRPQINATTAVTMKTNISHADSSVVSFREHHSADTLDNIWSQWRNEDESFNQFIQRIQQVDPTKSQEGFFLMQPNDPKYCFPDMVRHFLLTFLHI